MSNQHHQQSHSAPTSPALGSGNTFGSIPPSMPLTGGLPHASPYLMSLANQASEGASNKAPQYKIPDNDFYSYPHKYNLYCS